MRPDDIPAAWVKAAWQAYDNSEAPGSDMAMQYALAAVAPLIAERGREACAALVEELRTGAFGCKPRHWQAIIEFGRHLRSGLAAAIRARGEAKPCT